MHALHPHDMGCRTSIPTSSSIHGLLAARAYAARLSRNLLAKSAADAAEMPQLPGSARVTCKLHAQNALVAAMRHGMQRACQQNALASRGDSVNVITKSSCCGCCAGYAISCLHAVKVPDNHVSGGGSQRCTVAKSTAEHSRLPVKSRPFVPSSSHAPAPAPELYPSSPVATWPIAPRVKGPACMP